MQINPKYIDAFRWVIKYARELGVTVLIIGIGLYIFIGSNSIPVIAIGFSFMLIDAMIHPERYKQGAKKHER